MIIKTATLVEDYDFVYDGDDALDKSCEDFDERYQRFLETGDMAELPLKQGRSPAIWKLSHIRGKARRQLQGFIMRTSDNDQISPEALYVACRLALRDVEGLRDHRDEIYKIKKIREDGLVVVTESCMSELDGVDQGGLVNAIGLRAILAQVPEGNS